MKTNRSLLISELAEEAASGRGISGKSALKLSELPPEDERDLLVLTARLRERASGSRVFLCSIINAKSGRCGEDCRFCAQSAHYKTGAKIYPLVSVEEMAGAARSARENRAREFGIVTSGKAVADSEEVERIAEAIAEIAALGIHPCISPGIADEAALKRWQAAGLTRYHHNLEAAPSFFPAVCSTHRIEEDLESLQAAKAAGLPVCSGGIFGMGESWAQRVELALLLKELQVDSVPLNFLDPIPGTPMAETAPGIGPWEALKTIALFRLMMPDQRIIICGGRMKALGERQAEMFAAGANGLMIGNYLTTLGRPPAADLEMLSGLGLEPAAP